jgi:hypothetical protein
MSGFNKPWFFAGGWAIDLYLGKETRHHQDIEISIFRKDQLELKSFLKDCELKKVRRGEFLPWQDEFLELPIHEIHALDNSMGQKLEILFNETKGDYWLFRRDLTTTYPICSVYSVSEMGYRYLNPEIVLLYKAKNTREKDNQDFLAVKDNLDKNKKKWLQKAICSQYPEHEWLKLLI